MRAESVTTTEPTPADRRVLADLSTLYEKNVDDIYRFCLARSGQEWIADEATSEAFLAAARVFKRGKGAEVDRPWLFVVARRRVVDIWRRNQRERERAKRMGRFVERGHLDTESELGAVSDEVLQALKCLPERQRAAVALRYLDQYSVAEVADALQILYPAAESLLARGRRGFLKAWNANPNAREP